jgi:DNA-binding CsgD family transcriptional regulator
VKTLSPAESQIMRLVAQGFSTEEIAEIRGNAFHTVRTHLQNILGKLHARNRAHAVAIWLSKGRPEASVRIVGVIGETKLAGDFSHPVQLFENRDGLLARCTRCGETLPIDTSRQLVEFNDQHEHMGVSA